MQPIPPIPPSDGFQASTSNGPIKPPEVRKNRSSAKRLDFKEITKDQSEGPKHRHHRRSNSIGSKPHNLKLDLSLPSAADQVRECSSALPRLAISALPNPAPAPEKPHQSRRISSVSPQQVTLKARLPIGATRSAPIELPALPTDKRTTDKPMKAGIKKQPSPIYNFAKVILSLQRLDLTEEQKNELSAPTQAVSSEEKRKRRLSQHITARERDQLPVAQDLLISVYIQGGYENLDEERIRKMPYEQRQQLKKALDDERQQPPKVHAAKSTSSQTLSANTSRAAKVALCQQILRNIDEEERNRDLVDAIQQNKIKPGTFYASLDLKGRSLWDLFFLAGECIIPCKQLFSLIEAKIAKEMHEAAVDSARKYQSPRTNVFMLLDFSLQWLRANRGTSFVSAISKNITTIIELTKDQVEAKTFRTDLEKELGGKYVAKNEGAKFNVSQNEDSFCKTLLPAIRKNKNIDQHLQNVLCDFHYTQLYFYTQVTGHQLLYDKASSVAVKRQLTKLFKNTPLYFISVIFDMPKFEDRVRFIKFLLDLSKQSLETATPSKKPLEVGNPSLAFSIHLTFIAGPVGRLKKTWAKVFESEPYKAQYSSLENLFNPGLGFTNYREYIKKQTRVQIPCINVLEADLPRVREPDGILPAKPLVASTYNFEKLRMIYETIALYLAPQKECYDIFVQEWKIYQRRTDLVSQILSYNPPENDIGYFERAKMFEASDPNIQQSITSEK